MANLTLSFFLFAVSSRLVSFVRLLMYVSFPLLPCARLATAGSLQQSLRSGSVPAIQRKDWLRDGQTVRRRSELV